LAHPLRVAEDVATLDLLSGGRVDCGVGRGMDPAHFAGYGIDQAESAARLEEGVQILRTALTGERFSFDGRFHQVRDAMLAPRPVQAPLLPIRLAANSSQTLDWAGRLGLPVLVAAHVNPLPRLTEMLGGYRLARAEAGHPSSPEDITVLAPVFTAPTIGQVKADTAAGFGWLDEISRAKLRQWRAAAQDGPAGEATRRRLDEMATHFSAFDFDTMARTRGFVDTPDGVIERLQALRDTVGVGRVICWFNVGGLLPPDRVRAAMGLFAAEVMPVLADRGNLDRLRTAADPSPRDRSSSPARP
jgi:alkanesulfonate monooxygenase SsuD/methylene tetrahydromethanopterin reductase-like flavin-dependent oxidoreductase (luciferase family)